MAVNQVCRFAGNPAGYACTLLVKEEETAKQEFQGWKTCLNPGEKAENLNFAKKVIESDEDTNLEEAYEQSLEEGQKNE